MWISPITDRTASDAAYARKVQSDAAEPLKGAMNAVDLNRIESNCRFICEQLNRSGYSISIETKTDWSMEDLPKQAAINRIRQNVVTLREKYHTMAASPDIRVWEGLDWADANSLEQNLQNLDTLLQLMAQCFRKCGQFMGICGNEVTLPV